jgi:hypothetical protein
MHFQLAIMDARTKQTVPLNHLGSSYLIYPPRIVDFISQNPIIHHPTIIAKMAATTRYHILPEEARPSMDELPPSALEDERLLGPDSEVSFSHTPEPSSSKEMALTFHPSMILRLLCVALLGTSLGLFCGSRWRRPADVTAIVFLSMALLRHLLVISMHVVGQWVSFQIEIVGRDGTARVLQGRREGRACKKGKKWLQRYGMHILIESVILVGLIPSTAVGYGHGNIAAVILFWVAL